MSLRAGRMNLSEDFAYQHMSDSEEPSASRLGRRASTAHMGDAAATSSFVGVTPPGTPAAAAQTSAVHVQFVADTVVPSLKHLQANSSDDWAAEEIDQQDVRTLRHSSHGRRESNHSGMASSAAPHHGIDVYDNSSVTVVQAPSRPSIKVQMSNLHGKDLSQFVSISSIEPISRRSNSIDWSDTMATPDETDHLSLMDPYYDLTRSKLTKLFSLFHPDGKTFIKLLW